jgi:hypothetical protein
VPKIAPSLLDLARSAVDEAHAEHERLTGFLLVAFGPDSYTIVARTDGTNADADSVVDELLEVLQPSDRGQELEVGPCQGSA